MRRASRPPRRKRPKCGLWLCRRPRWDDPGVHLCTAHTLRASELLRAVERWSRLLVTWGVPPENAALIASSPIQYPDAEVICHYLFGKPVPFDELFERRIAARIGVLPCRPPC